MNEEKTDENDKTENSAGDTGEGDKPETSSIVERADAVAERLEKANEERKAIIAREEEIMARKALGGKSEGATQPKSNEPMSDKEYKDYFLKYGKPPEGEK